VKAGWVRIVRVAYLATIAVGVGWLLIDRWAVLRELLGAARPSRLLLALALSFGMLYWGSRIWHQVLIGVGADVDAGTVLLATARSVPGRYIPGSIWFALGRAALLRSAGVRPAALGLAATVEMALSIAVTLGIGATVLAFTGLLPGGGPAAGLAAAAIIVALSPPVVQPVLGWLLRRRGVAMEPMSLDTYARVVLSVVVFWVWSALTFITYLSAFPPFDGLSAGAVGGGFLFSWGVGFLAFIAPQGLGVFELTLASLLGVGETATVALAIGGYRVVILVRDAVTTAGAEIIAARRGDRRSRPTG
jgi:hypothetical protein